MVEAADWARSRVADIQSYLMCTLAPSCRHPGTFTFQGRTLTYVRRPYNRAWLNERSVELAIAFDFIDARPAEPMLEVGNVLGHYGRKGHTVVDKYETRRGVINEDITTWSTVDRFHTVVALSTLEHVGWDETPRQPDKVLVAVDRLNDLLAPGGRLLVTVPVRYNPFLDERLATDQLGLTPMGWLVRKEGNTWEETSADVALATPYLSGQAFAGAIFVGRSEG
jgi:hypothetical protein